ncbi:MAG TPA: RuBisCO large subunit C-terminal-like domain-containing protein, partial [Anaerolineaceae bacterium]|nr:RuBisCO large subunit C-terminal-like domain-containing protein [Anaerolineaceae bacterium]
MSLKDYSFSYPEELSGKAYSLATFFVAIQSTDNIDERAAGLAVGQTIGTWTEVPGVTESMLRDNMGRVVGVYETPPAELTTQLPENERTFIVQIAFPEVNIGAVMPMLLTTLLGNDVSTSAQVKLLDIQMSAEYLREFKGPRFGLQGIRERTGVEKRALILNVLKPCTGFPPEVAVPWFEESARAGSDVIKDDELLCDPSFNRLEKRVRLFHEAAERVYQQTGHRALYCANVTSTPERTIENARRAKELGADLIMVNAVASGLGILQTLRNMDDVNLPILSHFAGFATMTESQRSGIASPLLLGKLLRVAGADAISFPSPFSAYPLLREQFVRISRNIQKP